MAYTEVFNLYLNSIVWTPQSVDLPVHGHGYEHTCIGKCSPKYTHYFCTIIIVHVPVWFALKLVIKLRGYMLVLDLWTLNRTSEIFRRLLSILVLVFCNIHQNGLQWNQNVIVSSRTKFKFLKRPSVATIDDIRKISICDDKQGQSHEVSRLNLMFLWGLWMVDSVGFVCKIQERFQGSSVQHCSDHQTTSILLEVLPET